MSHKLFSNLIHWSKSQYSHLPWREKRTLYRTLVSEIMLQQTTVGTVLNHFERFLSEYPTIAELAKASEEDICISWKGLGYYRRARSLRSLAIQIMENHKGVIPAEIEELKKLKGVGPYTSNAIVAIGADKKGLAVDANIERVLARFFGFKEIKGPKLQKKIWECFHSNKILTEMNALSPRALNEAFMDLGRILCQARKASCALCPLASNCVAKMSGDPLAFPQEVEKKKEEDLYIKILRVIVREKKKVLVYQKADKEWLAGQWELPSFIIETNDETLKQYPLLKMKKIFTELPMIKTGITKYTIENYILEIGLDEFQKITKGIKKEYEFKMNNDRLNLSTTSMKVLKKTEKRNKPDPVFNHHSSRP